MRNTVWIFILSTLARCSLAAQPAVGSTTWIFDRTDSVGGCSATPLRKLPTIIETPFGKAALFSCYDSTALLVNSNPVGSDTSFTVEVYFRPDSTILSGTNNEQRFVHIRNLSNDNRRILMELRQLPSQRWLLDTYIKSEVSNLTLVDSSTSHTSGEWHHVAVTYSSGVMRQYVDGKQILSGPVTYLPIDINGKTSIGARQDPRSWFNGAIRMVKVTRAALTPDKFTIPIKTGMGNNHVFPQKTQLIQNFPNPFNPTTLVLYQLEREAPVLIKILNALGQEVATLVHETKPAGTHRAIWNAASFSSGIYFCTMLSGSYSSTKKIILMK